MKNDIKDTVEFLSVNIGALGLSLTNIDSILRTLILTATLIYSIQKILRYGKKK
tara:strand:- start:722 stop:883 length:162 start_codon:yes stop_codon:yes gene_type:complete